jgi:hypothetical protein
VGCHRGMITLFSIWCMVIKGYMGMSSLLGLYLDTMIVYKGREDYTRDTAGRNLKILLEIIHTRARTHMLVEARIELYLMPCYQIYSENLNET